jgi:hypothetical protein
VLIILGLIEEVYRVDRKVYILGYGDQAHPIYNTLVIHNSGVEITTNEGASARILAEKLLV